MTQRLLALGMVLFLGIPLGAQSQATQTPAPTTGSSSPQNNGPSPIQTQVTAVIVPVTVKDSEGRLVGDLTKDDFRVISDGVQQKILLFTSDPFPLSAVVVIDNDLAQKAAEQVKKSLTTVSAAFGPDDEVALVSYEEFPTTLSDFSTNNDDLFTKLKRLDLGSHTAGGVSDPTTVGPTINGQAQPNGQPQQAGVGYQPRGSGRYKNNNDLDDALYAAGQMLKSRGRGRRKIIFLISDGQDSRNNRHTFDETLHSLLVSDVSVYSIDTSHSLVPVGKRLLEHGVSEIDRFADRTGGDTFYASKENDLERLYSDVTEEARNQYTLTFQPAGDNRTRDYHTIEVRVLRPGLNVTARQGYYQSALGIGH